MQEEGRLLYIYIAGPLVLGIIYIHVLRSDAKGHLALPAASPMLVSVAVDRAVDTKGCSCSLNRETNRCERSCPERVGGIRELVNPQQQVG